jgi:hypothetical protein
MRLAASRIQIAPEWPPVACNMNKTDGNSPATGGHAGTICVRLAATRFNLNATGRQSHAIFSYDCPPDINYLPSCGQLHTFTHRVYRVPEFLASRLNWLPLLPSVSPPRIQVGGTHSLGGKRLGGANSDEGTDTMILCILFPSLCLHTCIKYK